MATQTGGETTRGSMIAVCSAKGGVGRTVIAANIAVALCKKTMRVALLDGDLQFGDMSMAFDIKAPFTIKDVAEDDENLDTHSLSNYLISHESGVRLLAAPERPEFADLIHEGLLKNVIDLLLVEHDYLVVDTPVGLQEQGVGLLEKADHILLLTNLEMATLKNTKLMLETLNVLGLRDKVQLVINRSTMDSVIKATDIPTILKDDAPFYLPNDFQVVAQSLNMGIPFVMSHAKNDVSKAVFKLAERLTSGNEMAIKFSKKPSLISKLFVKS